MHSVLLARWTYAMRMHSEYRAHVLKKSTSAQRVAGALDGLGLGLGQRTAPVR